MSNRLTDLHNLSVQLKMKVSKTIVLSILFTILIGLAAINIVLQMDGQQNKPEEEALQETIRQEKFQEKVSSLQIPFIKNIGQMDEMVAFYASTFGGTVFVTNEGQIVYSLPKTGEEEEISNIILKETVVGAVFDNVNGQEQVSTQINYFKGNDKEQWRSNIPTYNIVSLGELYQGVSLNLRAYGNNVEKLFVVKPGAEPEQIRLSMEGTEYLSIDEKGQLIASTSFGPVAFTKPVAYQEINGTKKDIEAAYTLNKIENEYGFTIDQYNPDYELIIDPLLASTFLGGTSTDLGVAIAVDNNDLMCNSF